MRTVIAIVLWICYLATINLYYLTFNLINQFISKLIYLWPSFIILTYCAIDILYGFVNYKHRAFIVLCFSAISANFLLMILYFQFGMDNYTVKFCTFNIIEFFTALFILISGTKRKIFNDK